MVFLFIDDFMHTTINYKQIYPLSSLYPPHSFAHSFPNFMSSFWVTNHKVLLVLNCQFWLWNFPYGDLIPPDSNNSGCWSSNSPTLSPFHHNWLLGCSGNHVPTSFLMPGRCQSSLTCNKNRIKSHLFKGVCSLFASQRWQVIAGDTMWFGHRT